MINTYSPDRITKTDHVVFCVSTRKELVAWRKKRGIEPMLRDIKIKKGKIVIAHCPTVWDFVWCEVDDLIYGINGIGEFSELPMNGILWVVKRLSPKDFYKVMDRTFGLARTGARV